MYFCTSKASVDDFVFVNPPDGAHFTKYLLYWYKSTNTDAARCIADMLLQAGDEILVLAEDDDSYTCNDGTHFTCFTGTKVHILTLRSEQAPPRVLILLALLVQKYTY